jgi:hypothetical protein
MVFDFDYTIDTYETHSYQNNIIVEDGATLTIKGHVYLKPDKAIIVKVGGHLVVDGGLISNSCIGVLAQGIVVEGNPDEDQSPESNQGLCELKNQGLIENMHNGVLLAGLELDGNGHCVTDLDKTGGIVKAKDFTFRNCYVGAEFFEYIAHSTHPQHWPIPNHSYFYNCDFETTRVLDLSTLGFQPEPKAGIIMNGTYKIKILGCRMANYAVGTDPFFDSQYKRGDGIQAFNAIFTVKNYCETTACPNPIQSSFENLEHGVLSLCYDFTSTFDVRDATFTNNYCGIRSEGALLGPIIRNCDFYINDLDDNSDGEEPVGINLDNTTAFHVQENHFYDTSAGTGPPTIGIALQNTALNGLNPSEIHETSSNQIYRNWFEGLDIACNVEGINQVEDANNPQESFGLEFRCNKFGQLGNDCQKDFNLFAGASVQKTQGSYLGNGVAGNLFYDSDCDYDYEHWDAGMGASPLTHYYYLQDSQSAILKPICSDENETNPLLVFGSFDENSTCPVQLVSPIITNPQIIKQDHAVKKSAFINTQNVFHGVLDGGDPLALKNLIENPASESAEIRNELLEFSPNISDQIWARCIERQPAMNPWHLTQVLLHASPLGSTVLRMVKNSNMPQNFKNMVENGQYEGMRDKEIFESDLATLAQEANELRSQFLRHYVLFEEDENIDVMTPVLQFLNESEVHLDKYLQAAFLQSKGAFASSGNVLNYCIKTSPQKEYYQVLETILEARQAQTFPNLSLLQMSDLVTLSADEYTCGTTQARALHRRLTETEYPMNINTEIPSLRSQRISSIQNSAMTFQIQPNPANGQCWIQFPYSPEAANVELILIDITGKLVAQSSLISAKGLYELNTTKLEDGLYIVQLQIDHMLVGTEKLTIQH